MVCVLMHGEQHDVNVRRRGQLSMTAFFVPDFNPMYQLGAFSCSTASLRKSACQTQIV